MSINKPLSKDNELPDTFEGHVSFSSDSPEIMIILNTFDVYNSFTCLFSKYIFAKSI